MQPILHLSFPVRDVVEARHFYVEVLGCEAARAGDGFQDVWFYGMQITLQDRPDDMVPLSQGSSRHFGVTLGRAQFESLIARLVEKDVVWVVPVSTEHEGLGTEQTKAKIADPSGNVIELKTYRDVEAALEISPHAYPEALEHGN